jgi:NADP-dependent 3-hydroxy acid dehydrogenase YdfG
MLKDQIVLVTGASSGIGAATARKFAASGARLLLCARRLDRLESLAEELRAEYAAKVHVFVLDVAKRDDVSLAFAELPEAWREIDILVNNAGLAAGKDQIAEANIDDWEQMIDVNLKGLLYVTREVLPGMIQRNRGSIVNIASTAGHIVYPGGSVYCATKHAVRAISKTLNLELMASAIRVCSVDPGIVETEFSQVRFKGSQNAANEVYTGFTPLTGDDVADAVVYCVSRPAHVQISEIVMLATAQGDGRSVHRG